MSDYEDEFIKSVTDTDLRERNKGLAEKKKRLLEIQNRIKELDKLFQRIYEDNINGKLSDERFMKLSQDMIQSRRNYRRNRSRYKRKPGTGKNRLLM